MSVTMERAMKLRNRIEQWLAAANCNCTGEPKVYCTYCDILFEVLDYMDAAEQTSNSESEKTDNVEPDSGSAGSSGVAVEQPQDQTGTGESAGAGRSERSEESKEEPGDQG